MATTQQVKFHSVDKDKYNSIASKDPGGLYFITDNGEIRKGDDRVTGTRVYNATDTAKTVTAIESLTIKIGNTAITGEGVDQPKRGDMLLVTRYLKFIPDPNNAEQEIPDTTGPVEYSAYVYETDGGTYSASGWKACDGNVDASKVILTSDITMAGNYASIGNFTKTQSGYKDDFLENGEKTSGVSV